MSRSVEFTFIYPNGQRYTSFGEIVMGAPAGNSKPAPVAPTPSRTELEQKLAALSFPADLIGELSDQALAEIVRIMTSLTDPSSTPKPDATDREMVRQYAEAYREDLAKGGTTVSKFCENFARSGQDAYEFLRLPRLPEPKPYTDVGRVAKFAEEHKAALQANGTSAVKFVADYLRAWKKRPGLTSKQFCGV